jgi:hypothetical protein
MEVVDMVEKIITEATKLVFLNRVKKDIKSQPKLTKEFYNSLTFKHKFKYFLSGKTYLKRVEVIELARKLKRSIEEYIDISGYMPAIFKEVLEDTRHPGLIYTTGPLSDKDIDQFICSLEDILKTYAAEKKAEARAREKASKLTLSV